MAAEKSDAAIEDIQKKVDTLSKEIAALGSDIKEIQTLLSPISKMEDLISSVNTKVVNVVGKKVDDLSKSVKGMDPTKKIDEIAKTVSSIGSDVTEVKDSKESEVIIKKVDDILISIADVEVIVKKLDDLQGYIAGLSGIEEKVQDLSSQFGETNEIVGIIVRQLDDIERKYNLAINKVAESIELISKFIEEGGALAPTSEKTPKKQKETTEKKTPKVKDPTKASLPSTIDSLMTELLDLVVPQTEATEMAKALEDVRDQLTTQIEGHTPVLFQFGKRAREFKSYPPTATLNENDIASLSREIKTWTGKLKETVKSGK